MDLKMADLIKMYPMNGRQVVLGELMAPAFLLTLVQWMLLPMAVGGLISLDQRSELRMDIVGGFAIALAFLIPMMNLLSFCIPNASVLLFPAWFQTDRTMPHGIEAMGQRIVLLLGQMLVLFASVLPAGVVFTVVLLLLKWAVGWLVAAPVAGLTAAAVMAVEVWLAVAWMGRWFERLDVSEAGTA